MYINIQGEYSTKIFGNILHQKYSGHEYPNEIFFKKIPTKYSEAEWYLSPLNAFPVIVSTLSVMFHRIFQLRFFFCGQFMWNEKKAPIFLWFCMLHWKMSGLQNSGQYCYFNSLMQVFAKHFASTYTLKGTHGHCGK